MNLPIDILLAMRYLRPKRSVLSIVTLLAVFGPAIGVAVLLIVVSVMSGFDSQMKRVILGSQAHIQIVPYRYFGDDAPLISSDEVEGLSANLKKMGLKSAPVIEGNILIQHNKKIVPKYLRGVDCKREKEVSEVINRVCWGNPKRYGNLADGEAIIGSILASELSIDIYSKRNNKIFIHSPKKLTSNLEWQSDGSVKIKENPEVYVPTEITVVGTISMGVQNIDANFVVLNIDTAADIFGYDWGDANCLNVKTKDPFQLNRELSLLKEKFGNRYHISSWQERSKEWFDVLANERIMMFFVLSFIVFIASFAIMATLITVAVQKTKEIGILKAVGVSRWIIARIFLLQGVFYGIVGPAVGVGSGLLILKYRNELLEFIAKTFHRNIFPPDLYQFTKLPCLVKFNESLMIVLVSFSLCVLSSIIPALYASFLSPVDALKEEN